jgi:phage terminase large subunit-like protein
LDYQSVSGAVRDTLTLNDFRDCYCVGGVDLSQTTDLTACSVVIEREDKLYTFCQFFMPRERIKTLEEIDGVPYSLYVSQGLITASGDNYIDYHDCFDWFRELVEEYKILPLQIGYDRYSAKYLIDDLSTYGFHTDDVYQGENLTPVIQEFEGILRDKNFYICGNNNLLKSHFLNVALKHNAETRRSRPVKIGPTEHIDGFVSVIDAMTVRQKYYGEIGIQLKNAG